LTPGSPFSASALLGSELARKAAPWLEGTGAHSDVVISSRARLARNFVGFPFLTRADPRDRAMVLDAARQRLIACGLSPRVLFVNVHDASNLERTFMVERHLISKEHARGVIPGQAGASSSSSGATKEESGADTGSGVGGGSSSAVRAVAISMPDEAVSVMVNEEDHLRIQVLASGLGLSQAFARVNDVDDRVPGPIVVDALPSDRKMPSPRAMPAALEYAYSGRFGFVTACPTNVGTGIRVSVMLHLPGLKLLGDIEKVRRATRDMSLAVRGYYGENSEAAGELYQISNQTTLGKPEGVILHEIEKEIMPQVIAYERVARATLMEKRRRMLEDKVFRALGTLRSARLLTPEEAIGLLSDVRLGVVTGLITDVSQAIVNQLILLTQPAHLQVALGKELDQQQRREARADLVRQRLTPGATEAR
jgi:protein arginine kinase